MSRIQARYIIYVDATGAKSNSKFKISLYDKQTNATHILALGENINNSTEAESYAIIYAIMYINKHNVQNAIVLCDNRSSVENEVIRKSAELFNIQLSWIPREINVVADRVAKLNPTLKEKELYLLEMFVKLLNAKTNNNDTVTIENLNKQLKTKNEKIANQTKQLNSLKKSK